MLFHVAMTHTEATCPGYQRQQMPAFIADAEKLDTAAQELNVRMHSIL